MMFRQLLKSVNRLVFPPHRRTLRYFMGIVLFVIGMAILLLQAFSLLPWTG